MNSIKYSQYWDKLKCNVGEKFTTIRNRYNYEGSRALDKLDYYQTGSTYQQIINDRPAFTARLYGIETIVGSRLPEYLILEDVKFNGVPDEAWIKKIKGMKEGLLLRFTKITEDTEVKL